MSSYSELKEGVEQLAAKLDELHAPPRDKNIHIGLFYLAELTRTMAKMTDDIHKISKTLEEMNRRRS